MKATIDIADIDTIVLRNYLEQCTEGDEVYYKSTSYANFDGCFIEIRGNRLNAHVQYASSTARERPVNLTIAVQSPSRCL